MAGVGHRESAGLVDRLGRQDKTVAGDLRKGSGHEDEGRQTLRQQTGRQRNEVSAVLEVVCCLRVCCL